MVFLVGIASNNTRMFACVYSSETGKWSNLISTAALSSVCAFSDPGILVGRALYWMPVGHHGCTVLQFDLDRQNLAVIEWPSDSNSKSNFKSQIMIAEGGGLGLAIFSCKSLQLWERKVCSEGVSKWALKETYELKDVLNLGSRSKIWYLVKLGYVQDIKVMLLWVDHSIFMLQLDSLQAKKLWETCIIAPIHPYASTYIAENPLWVGKHTSTRIRRLSLPVVSPSVAMGDIAASRLLWTPWKGLDFPSLLLRAPAATRPHLLELDVLESAVPTAAAHRWPMLDSSFDTM